MSINKRAVRLTPFQSRLRRLFESLLSRRLSEADGVRETRKWPVMPCKLRQYYQIVGGVKSINRCFNRLYSPNKQDDEGGYRIFMEENQNVVVWAFKLEDAEADNPKIYQACCLENGDLGKWFPSAERCDDWLVSMVYWQVVNGGFHFGAYKSCRRDLRRRLAARWPLIVRVPDQGPMLFYGRNGQLLC